MTFRRLSENSARILIVVCAICFSLVLMEYSLRWNGFKPGFRNSSAHFKEVDSLYILKGFYTDSNGITCLSQETGELARIRISENSLSLYPPDGWHGGAYHLPSYYLTLQDKNYHSTFKSFLESLELHHDSSDSNFFEAVKNYVRAPINSSGFRSIEFKKYDSGRKSILLLGDSYTYGHSASNITNSFADLLLAKGHVVYNTGIIATDPAQYLQIARILIPVLEPDFVVVNFFIGNDIQYYKREPLPNVPVFYCTNAGNLISCPDGVYFNNEREVYDYSLSNFTIPGKTLFNRFCANFSITTLLWKALDKYGMTDNSLPQYEEYYRRVREVITSTPHTNLQLKEIKSIAEKFNGKFRLVVIPSPKQKKLLFPSKGQPVFDGLEFYYPNVSKENYRGRGHYNDSGHAIHASFIDSLIKAGI